MLTIEKLSFGIGDRFTLQGKAQLEAIVKANASGIPLVPVWNKSNREHQIVKTAPADTWKEASNAISSLSYASPWYVDADHINLNTVENYIEYSNFFTLDVADAIGKPAADKEVSDMLKKLAVFKGLLEIPGIEGSFEISEDFLKRIIDKYYVAVKEASLIYQFIKNKKGNDIFVPEVSMDEVDEAQTPVDLFFILVMLDYFDLPVQTIAPKFTGRFNKGVDYVGDIEQFRKEFEQDILVIDHVVNTFGLPGNLKLSVHSGSDKFSIYPVIGELIKKHDKGIHVKTAGTTWLEEVIGLAMAGGEALEMAKYIYTHAYKRQDELCGPYASVIDIDPAALPTPETIAAWDSTKFEHTLRHIPDHPDYDPMFRQLIHVGYKIAAELGNEYLDMISKYQDIVGAQVTENIYERHIKRLFT